MKAKENYSYYGEDYEQPDWDVDEDYDEDWNADGGDELREQGLI